MSITRSACVLLLAIGLAPAVQAEDPSAPVTKPTNTGTPPARAPVKGAPSKNAPAAAKPAAASTDNKAPAAKPTAPEADDELLEFLGSVDGLEGLEK